MHQKAGLQEETLTDLSQIFIFDCTIAPNTGVWGYLEEVHILNFVVSVDLNSKC